MPKKGNSGGVKAIRKDSRSLIISAINKDIFYNDVVFIQTHNVKPESVN